MKLVETRQQVVDADDANLLEQNTTTTQSRRFMSIQQDDCSRSKC